jgi:hypothetical protein
MNETMEATPARVEIERGARAQELRDNPLLAEALSVWETEVVETWKRSPLRDVEARERLRLMLEASKEFRAFLQITIERGQLAKVPTQQPRSVLQKVREFVK